MTYLFHIITMLAIYAILTQSLNIAMGYGGLLSLSHAAFYGLGAYTAALLMMQGIVPFAAAMLVAILLTGIVAFLVAYPATRFRGDFFVLVSMAVQMILFVIYHNWTNLTGGPYGISGIPKPTFFGQRILHPGWFSVLASGMAFIVFWGAWRLLHSPFGRTLQAIREDELAALALGKDVSAFKREAFAISAAFAAIAGVLFASYSTYIDAQVFSADESIFIFCALVIGGAGGFWGPLVGAAILVLVPEGLRLTSMPDAIAANLRQVLFGLMLVLLMRFRPQGLLGKYSFD